MIAAAARTSGTRSPLASTLYRGGPVSVISRAVATARARASVALREADRWAEYRRFCAGRVVVDDLRGVSGAASAPVTPILTRHATARVPIQQIRVLRTLAAPRR